MQKLFKISLIAVLSVSPLMAMGAGDDPTAATIESEPYLGKDITNTDRASTASVAYTKGAYNAVIGAVNAEHTTTTNALSGKQGTVSGGDGISVSNNTVSADVASNGGLELNQGKLQVKTDGTTIGKDSNGALKVVNGSIGTTQLSSAVNTTIGSKATETGLEASIDNATATGNISATVSGTIGGPLSSNVSGLRFGGGTISNTVTPTTATVSVPTQWSGSLAMVDDWETPTSSPLSVTVNSTNSSSTTVLTGVGVSSSLANATVTSGNLSHTLSGLRTSGTATQNGVSFDLQVSSGTPATPTYDFSSLNASSSGTVSDYSVANQTWSTAFSYGTVSGTALCSVTEGTYAQAGEPNEINTGNDALNCWCKATGYTPTGSNTTYANSSTSDWAFLIPADTREDCLDSCANACAAYVGGYSDMREAVFGITQ